MDSNLWAPRIRLWQLARLYRLAGLGVYDDDLLLEVGWGLYARALDVVLVAKAVGGVVPCPQCGDPVERPSKRSEPRVGRGGGVECAGCGGVWTWWDVKETLRNQPKCLHCLGRLTLDFARNVLECASCAKSWTWKRYRSAVRGRMWLPCPRCEARLHRPPSTHGGGTTTVSEVACPKCGQPAEHAPGRLSCFACGHEEAWSTFRRRSKSRDEALTCGACGHTFGWRAWRARYRGRHLLTGKPQPAEAYLERWPKARTEAEKLHAIDTLVNAIHGRGAMGPLFLEGTESAVLDLLNRLASP